MSTKLFPNEDPNAPKMEKYKADGKTSLPRFSRESYQRGWREMPDGHALIIKPGLKYNPTELVYCKVCDSYIIPVSAIQENADGSDPVLLVKPKLAKEPL